MNVADGLDVAGLVEEVENHRRSSEEEEEDTHAEVNTDRLGPPRGWRHRKVLPAISSDCDMPLVAKLQHEMILFQLQIFYYSLIYSSCRLAVSILD